MTTLTEGRHAAEFILSEANGHRSRENGTVVLGQNLAAGTVVMDNGAGKLTALTALTTDVLDGTVKGILIYPIDATLADVAASYIARDAEVNGELLTYPTETTDAFEAAATNAALLALGILVR